MDDTLLFYVFSKQPYYNILKKRNKYQITNFCLCESLKMPGIRPHGSADPERNDQFVNFNRK